MIGRDKNPTVCRAGSKRHFDVTAFRDRVNFVTQLFVHLECSLEERESVGDAERRDIRHSASICLYFSHLQAHAWNSLKGTRVWLKTLQIFAGLIRPVNRTFNSRNRLLEGCACVRLYYLGEGEMFFQSLLFSLFIRPSEKKKSFFFSFIQNGG